MPGGKKLEELKKSAGNSVLGFRQRSLCFVSVGIKDADIDTGLCSMALSAEVHPLQVIPKGDTVGAERRTCFEGMRCVVSFKIAVIFNEDMAWSTGVVFAFQHVLGTHMPHTGSIGDLHVCGTGHDVPMEEFSFHSSGEGDDFYLAVRHIHLGQVTSVDHDMDDHNGILRHRDWLPFFVGNDSL